MIIEIPHQWTNRQVEFSTAAGGGPGEVVRQIQRRPADCIHVGLHGGRRLYTRAIILYTFPLSYKSRTSHARSPS